jgi:predicted dehydrogenase
LSQFIFGRPENDDILAAGTFTETGVDASCAMIFQFPGNKIAMLHSTIATHTPIEAYIHGTLGSIHLHSRWHHPTKLTLSKFVGKQVETETIEMPHQGWGYAFEAKHVMECLAENLVESPLVPLGFSEELMETLDAVREKIGLVYDE